MPTIAIIGNIRIMIHTADHPPAHCHAYSPDGDAKIEIATGRVVEADMQRRALKAATDWVVAHQDELLARWAAIHEDED